MKNIFKQEDVAEIIARIEKLQPNQKPLWGKMSVAQMLAHCNIAYEMVYSDKHPKPNEVKKFLLKLFVKKMVVGEKPYKKNAPTAPVFVVKEEKDFKHEKERLIAYLKETNRLGTKHFDRKESHSFGKLSQEEWNNLFSKHLSHHLDQFDV